MCLGFHGCVLHEPGRGLGVDAAEIPGDLPCDTREVLPLCRGRTYQLRLQKSNNLPLRSIAMLT